MADLSTRVDLANKLFSKPKSSTAGTNMFYGTAASDSTNGVVQVIIGEDEAGEDVVVEMPTVAAISEGDQVTVINNNGTPQAIGASGWGDNVQEQVNDAMEQIAASNNHF